MHRDDLLKLFHITRIGLHRFPYIASKTHVAFGRRIECKTCTEMWEVEGFVTDMGFLSLCEAHLASNDHIIKSLANEGSEQ